ncbi:MAG: autotransporter domain-containing protein [Flavobacteriales bacterium]|nr:autotransporter domain-containing protein [Flavobacteriales bacterium]
MKTFLVAWLALMLPSMGLACDVCGIFLGIQPHDRANSFSVLYRYRHLEGRVPGVAKSLLKHGGHGVDAASTGSSLYRELYMVAELRADIWLSQRFSVLAALPLVNNYQAVNGVIAADVYGVGDPLLIGRFQLVNTKCTTLEERTVHRVRIGVGAKAPLGQHDLAFRGEQVHDDLQPGTGSWDALGTLEYMVRRNRNGASLSIIGRANGEDADGMRMGNGLSTTAEFFRRWDLGENWKLMPSLGAYWELTGKDAHHGTDVEGTGASTLFASAGARAWWRSWGVQAIGQFVVAQDIGQWMVPNKERFVIGLTYNINNN